MNDLSLYLKRVFIYIGEGPALNKKCKKERNKLSFFDSFFTIVANLWLSWSVEIKNGFKITVE